MKPMILALALLSTALFANAQNQTENIRVFKVENAKFSPNHVKSPGAATLTVNYSSKMVTLEVVEKKTTCPAGMACIQVMPSPLVVELPITSIQYDSCGIATVTAKKDLRPVDGAFEQIKLQDISKLTCLTIAPVVAKASYTTKIVSRMNGKESSSVSRMEIKLMGSDSSEDSNEESFQMAKAHLIKGFRSMEIPSAGLLQISDKEIGLTIEMKLDCKPNAPCPAYMPTPLQVFLPIVRREKSGCGDTIIARTLQNSPADPVTEVEVVDYRTATCEIYLPHPIKVNYRHDEMTVGGRFEAAAVFFFDAK